MLNIISIMLNSGYLSNILIYRVFFSLFLFVLFQGMPQVSSSFFSLEPRPPPVDEDNPEEEKSHESLPEPKQKKRLTLGNILSQGCLMSVVVKVMYYEVEIVLLLVQRAEGRNKQKLWLSLECLQRKCPSISPLSAEQKK